MLKIKLKKNKKSKIYTICVFDSKKKNPKNLKKIGYIDRIKKKINIKNIEKYIKLGIKPSKGIKKILKMLKKKNKYDIFIQK
ncbi:hypothetical protein [Candidatus Vidania fulgoroideorum]